MVQSSTVDFDLRNPQNRKLLDWGWRMRGDRKYLVLPITFSPEFSGRRPHVLLSVTRIDSTQPEPAITYSVEPRNISTAGFELALGIDSIDITHVQISWLAISSSVPEATHGDWQTSSIATGHTDTSRST